MKRKKITWRRERAYGCYMPSRGSNNPDTACFVRPEDSKSRPFLAIDRFYGESAPFKTLGAAKRWCEKRINDRS